LGKGNIRVRTEQKNALAVVVRPFMGKDRGRLNEITKTAFKGRCIESAIEESLGVMGELEWSERKARGLRSEISSPFVDILVADLNGNPIGYLTFEILRDQSTGWVRNLAVDPEFQLRGVGTQLLDAAIAEFRALGLKHVRIETLQTNEPARSFYHGKGFQEITQRVYMFREL